MFSVAVSAQARLLVVKRVALNPWEYLVLGSGALVSGFCSLSYGCLSGHCADGSLG